MTNHNHTQLSEERLEPCPLYGHQPQTDWDTRAIGPGPYLGISGAPVAIKFYSIICPGCCSTASFESRERAITAWNSRAAVAAPQGDASRNPHTELQNTAINCITGPQGARVEILCRDFQHAQRLQQALGIYRASPSQKFEEVAAVEQSGDDPLDNEAVDKELRRWQDAIRDKLIGLGAPDWKIDGAGCDSGDPLDFTLAEVGQGVGWFIDQLEEIRAAATPVTSDAVRKAANDLKPHLDPYFLINRDWQDQIAAIISRYIPVPVEEGDHKRSSVTPEVAVKLIHLRDTLAKMESSELVNEAWHTLYSIADPEIESFFPWTELEKLAASAV